MAFFLLQQSAESVVFVLHWPSDGSRNRSRESVKDLGGGGSQGENKEEEEEERSIQ